MLVATIQGASQLQRQSDLRARGSNESDQRQRAATPSFIHPRAARQGHEGLSKYLTKDVARAAGVDEDATDRQREHHRRLVAELRITPCSPRCGVWLIYGVQPKGARLGTVPGQCKGKAHKPEHLGIAGRRVLVSRKWSGKTLHDHRTERADFVRQLLHGSGVRPGYAVDDGPFEWESTKAGDPDVPTRPALLLHAISERQRWRADYDAAVALAGEPPDNRSATTEEAA